MKHILTPAVPCGLMLISLFAARAAADRAGNFPYVESGLAGRFYAKGVPDGRDGTKGTTQIYMVKKDADELLDTYDWYAPWEYQCGVVMGWSPIAGKVAIMRVHNEPGEAADGRIELSFYLGGKFVKSYTLRDLVALGAPPKPRLRGRDEVRAFLAYKVLGCEQVPRTNDYRFVIQVAGDKKVLFDIITGEVVSDVPESPVLRQLGVPRQAEALAAFLRAVRPDGEHGKQFSALIGQLGDESFVRREEASKALLAAKIWYPGLLAAAMRGPDPEVQVRSQQILAKLQVSGTPTWEEAMGAALSAIAHGRVAGLTAAVMEAAGTSADDRVAAAAVAALAATARREDAAVFRKALAGGNDNIRPVAARALDALLGPEAVDELLGLLKDRDERTRLAAALCCLNCERREALPVLVDMLDSNSASVRNGSFRALRAAVGQGHGLDPQADRADRAAAVQRWRAWLERDAATAVLTLPVLERIAAIRPGLVLWNRLGSAQEIAGSEVGPGGKWDGKGKFVRGVFGQAIELDINEKRAVSFPAEIMFSGQGCIEVWAQLVEFADAIPDGHSPAFVQAGENGSYAITLNGNDGNSGGGLCVRAGACGLGGMGQFGGWTIQRVFGKGREGDWHHYALSWNTKGIAGLGDGKQTVAMFLDGVLSFSRSQPGAADQGPLKGLLVLHDQHHLTQGRVRLDNLKVWNRAQIDFRDRLEDDGVEPPNRVELRPAQPPAEKGTDDRSRLLPGGGLPGGHMPE